MKRVTLSGKDNAIHPRTVYLDDKEICEVRPVRSKKFHCWLWEAVDTHGHTHGDHWIMEWYAAEALIRKPIKPPLRGGRRQEKYHYTLPSRTKAASSAKPSA